MASIEAAAGSPYSPIGGGPANIVQARGGNFVLGDNVIYPAGTSWCARHDRVAIPCKGACLEEQHPHVVSTVGVVTVIHSRQFSTRRYNILMIEMYTEQELREQLYTHWVNGVRVSDARVVSPIFA
jgi:hypothetical protein